MRTDDDRIDLSPLDPEADVDRLERVTSAILQRLGPGIVDDHVSLGLQVPRLLARRFRLLLGAATLVASIAAIMLARSSSRSVGERDAVSSGERDAVSSPIVTISPDLAALLNADPSIRTDELLYLVAGGGR